MKRRSTLLFLILFLLGSAIRAQVPELINDEAFRKDAQTAVDSIYNLNFKAADKQLRPWREQHPEHPLWELMEGIKLWWQVLSDLHDTSHDDEFFNLMKRVDYEASKLLRKQRSHVDALMIKVVSNGYIGRQYANRGEWLTSINQARKALSAYEYLLDLKPGLADLKLAEGMKLYYSAYLPEAYPIVNTVSWFLPDGDKKKGLQLMQEASEEAIFAQAEASYFLGNINYNYEHSYSKAIGYFKNLYEAYPNNGYYTRYYVRVLYRMNKYDKAMEVIGDALDRWENQELAFGDVLKEELYTWQGRMLVKRNRSEEAATSYRKAFELGRKLPQTHNRPYFVTSGYLLANLLVQREEQEEARKYLRQVVDAKAEPGYREAAQELLDKL